MKLRLTLPHSLDPAALRRRIEARVAHYRARYPALALEKHYRWTTDATLDGHYRGGAGRIELAPGELVVELDLPVLARLYRGRIEDFVRGEMVAVTRRDVADRADRES